MKRKELFPGTSWYLLQTDDAPVRPFDLHILNEKLQPTGAICKCSPPEAKSLADMHRQKIQEVIRSLPKDDEILESKTKGIADNAILAPYCDGPAVPAVTRTKPAAGTTGVASCVAVLVSGSRNQVTAYGCIHLSAVDMDDFDSTRAAIGTLWTAFTSQLGGGPDPESCRLYAIGGADDENLDWAELARVVGACELLAQTHQISFEDALLPVNAATGSVRAFINEDGVTYQWENR